MKFKKQILNYLQCFCGNGLRYKDNYLVCKYNHKIPITNGVPNFVKADNNVLKKSMKMWSYEWNKYNYRDVWETKKAFKRYIPIKDDELKKCKIVLEIGCGDGRCIQHIQKDKIVFGIDISDSVYIANKRYKNLNNVFIIKADVEELPFKRKTFDFVYSDHCLQHINSIYFAFLELKKVVKDKHRFIFNLYSKENNFIMTHIFEPLKIIWLRLPIGFVHFISNFLAIPLWLSIELVYKPLNKTKLYKYLPLSNHMESWFCFGYEVLRQSIFDLLYAPIVKYYSLNDIILLEKETDFICDKNLFRQTLWICDGSFKSK